MKSGSVKVFGFESGGKILDSDLVWNYWGSETLGNWFSLPERRARSRAALTASILWRTLRSRPGKARTSCHAKAFRCNAVTLRSRSAGITASFLRSRPGTARTSCHARSSFVMLSLSAPDQLELRLHFSVPDRGGGGGGLTAPFSPGRGSQMSPFHSKKMFTTLSILGSRSRLCSSCYLVLLTYGHFILQISSALSVEVEKHFSVSAAFFCWHFCNKDKVIRKRQPTMNKKNVGVRLAFWFAKVEFNTCKYRESCMLCHIRCTVLYSGKTPDEACLSFVVLCKPS
jgi:hypothetical protein